VLPSAAPMEAKPSAADLKDQGNAQFKAANYLKAAALYTQAIKLDPDNAALFRYPKTPLAPSSFVIGLPAKWVTPFLSLLSAATDRRLS
jgi:hypothetical protein